MPAMLAATVVAAALIGTGGGASTRALISIDGPLADWADVPVAWQDEAGDGGASGIDFGRLWLADDDRFLFIRVELGREVDLTRNNDLRIFLDTDANDATGLPVGPIGAELEWRVGDRFGTFYAEGGPTTVFQSDLSFRAAPTIAADDVEIAFARNAMPDGKTVLFPGPTIRVVVRDEGGDQVPQPGILSYDFDQGELPPEADIPFEREKPEDLRLVTLNVDDDAPWNAGQEERFGRLLVATMPDIVSFQEVYNHTAEEARDLVARWLPERTWYAAGNQDVKTVCAYEVVDSWAIDGNLAAFIDTDNVIGSDLLLINAHMPCCTEETARQIELDRLMAFVRDATTIGGDVDLPFGTPIVITGDLSLVGPSQQLATVVSGDIFDEEQFGEDFAPDWDGGDLMNLVSRQTEKRMGYTWRADGSLWPGQLDYFVYSDAVIDAGNHFIVYTPEMSAANLAARGLEVDDSLATDHLLVCADIRASCVADLDDNGAVDFFDLVEVLSVWGPCPDCPEDLDGDGEVGFLDVLVVLDTWGPCS